MVPASKPCLSCHDKPDFETWSTRTTICILENVLQRLMGTILAELFTNTTCAKCQTDLRSLALISCPPICSRSHLYSSQAEQNNIRTQPNYVTGPLSMGIWSEMSLPVIPFACRSFDNQYHNINTLKKRLVDCLLKWNRVNKIHVSI